MKYPKCWNCKKALKRVDETIYETWQFENGEYRELGAFGGVITITCHNCGANVSDDFPEGVCNWGK